MSYSFTEVALRDAVEKALRYEVATLPKDSEIEHKFSHGFERKMQQLIRKGNKAEAGGQVFPRKWAVSLTAAIFLLFVSVMSVPAVRAAVVRFVGHVYERFTHVLFESRSFRDADDEFTIYQPTYIPKGFVLVNRITEGLVLMEYERGNDFLSFSQQHLENVSMHINTEGVELEELTFEGFPARYYSNRGVQNLLWHDGQYFFMVSTTLGRDIVFTIAESVRATDEFVAP